MKTKMFEVIVRYQTEVVLPINAENEAEAKEAALFLVEEGTYQSDYTPLDASGFEVVGEPSEIQKPDAKDIEYAAGNAACWDEEKDYRADAEAEEKLS